MKRIYLAIATLMLSVATAWADGEVENYGLMIGPMQINSDNYQNLTNNLTWIGVLKEGIVEYEPTTRTLTLTNAHLETNGVYYAGIRNDMNDALNIAVRGHCTIQASGYRAGMGALAFSLNLYGESSIVVNGESRADTLKFIGFTPRSGDLYQNFYYNNLTVEYDIYDSTMLGVFDGCEIIMRGFGNKLKGTEEEWKAKTGENMAFVYPEGAHFVQDEQGESYLVDGRGNVVKDKWNNTYDDGKHKILAVVRPADEPIKSYDLYLCDTRLNEINVQDIPNYIPAVQGEAYFDGEKTLTVRDATLDCVPIGEEVTPIRSRIDNLNINLEGECHLTGRVTIGIAIFSAGTTTLNVTGHTLIDMGEGGYSLSGIVTDAALNLCGGGHLEFDVDDEGIYIDSEMSIDNTRLTVKSGREAFYSCQSGGVLNVSGTDAVVRLNGHYYCLGKMADVRLNDGLTYMEPENVSFYDGYVRYEDGTYVADEWLEISRYRQRYPLFVGGIRADEHNCADLLQPLRQQSGITVKDNPTAAIAYDPATLTLTLKDISISDEREAGSMPMFYFTGTGNLQLVGNNDIQPGSNTTLQADADVTIFGDNLSQSLTLYAPLTTQHPLVIGENAQLTVDHCNLFFDTDQHIIGDGETSALTVNNALVCASGIDNIGQLTLIDTDIIVENSDKEISDFCHLDATTHNVVADSGIDFDIINIVPAVQGLVLGKMVFPSAEYISQAEVSSRETYTKLFTQVGVLKSGEIDYDPDTRTLQLFDAVIENNGFHGALSNGYQHAGTSLIVPGVNDLNIEINGDCYLRNNSVTAGVGLDMRGASTSLTGNGRLFINDGEVNGYRGINMGYGHDTPEQLTLTVNGPKVETKGDDYGLYTNGIDATLKVLRGEFRTKGGRSAVRFASYSGWVGNIDLGPGIAILEPEDVSLQPYSSNGFNSYDLVDSNGNPIANQWVVIGNDGSIPTDIAQPVYDASPMHQQVYDLQGRQVENPARGIYIIGTRKVVVK